MPLTRAIEVVPSGTYAGDPIADRIELVYDERYRRRMRYVACGGTPFLLDLPRATVLQAGDALRLEDGRLIRIEAAPETLVEVTASDPGELARFAWHIGNRHVPAQVEAQRILIREDAVIVDMLRGLGASTRPIRAGFSPESGAYRTTEAEHEHSGHPRSAPHRGPTHAHDS
jgi:urease accessory protein